MMDGIECFYAMRSHRYHATPLLNVHGIEFA
ncbi:hypothetical protein CBM2587_A160033 [Cupriavidus taiwanensis]|uniref:Uncharacterized protein n=1 Tax=Cupriavidus taiwanensis TaxID=164546 RepID=A0A975WVM9_9BURK|nr:hypothetical protein CBM2587_A160033 [Cupriavidus taiwanensis]